MVSRDVPGSSEPLEHKGKDSSFCPSIGFEDDPETALAYPSPYNYCYHSKPIAPVSISHQRRVCLSLYYGDCPVYQKNVLEPLPKEYRGSLPARRMSKTAISILILLLVMIVGAAILGLLGIVRIPGLEFSLMAQQDTSTFTPPTQFVIVPPSTSTTSLTGTIIPTDTQSMIEATSFTPHAVETPFGENPTLVIHKVLEGEGYIYLAEQYGTSVEAIKAINYQLSEALWVNNILVIPVNTQLVTGLPKFIVREISTEGMTIEEYAQRMQLDAELLKRYNALPADYMLEMGELIIIPN